MCDRIFIPFEKTQRIVSHFGVFFFVNCKM
uniref:Uncharacterized protein n=1 Tax=Anguilla anguilla TaxID=7936 RepID=A0A0E9QZ03_ANGAN